ILTPDRQLLFTTNGGDNSVSSFRVGKDGRLTRLDVKPTGNAVEGKSGTAKCLAYAPAKGLLYVLHRFGPDHLRLMSGDAQGTPGAIHGKYARQDRPCAHHDGALARREIPPGRHDVRSANRSHRHVSRRLTYSLGPAAGRQIQVDRFECARSRRPRRIPRAT